MNNKEKLILCFAFVLSIVIITSCFFFASNQESEKTATGIRIGVDAIYEQEDSDNKTELTVDETITPAKK